MEERAGGEHGRHLAFVVRKRTFGYFTDDHHGDGRLALIVKASQGEQAVLVASDAEHYFVPSYLGPRGWVGYWLDVASVDWAEVRELLAESYCLCAPKKLAATVTNEGSGARHGDDRLVERLASHRPEEG